MKSADLRTKTIYATSDHTFRPVVVLDTESTYALSTRYGVTSESRARSTHSKVARSSRFGGNDQGFLVVRSDEVTLTRIIADKDFDDFVAAVTSGEPFDKDEIVSEFFAASSDQLRIEVVNPRQIEGVYAEIKAQREADRQEREARHEAAAIARDHKEKRYEQIDARLDAIGIGGVYRSYGGHTDISMTFDALEALLDRIEKNA